MDYTQSNSYATDAGSGNRLHKQAQAVPTAVSDLDMNSLIWSMMKVLEAAGIAGAQFDPAVPATYTKVRDAINVLIRLMSAGFASNTGTADALVGVFTPVVPALVNGLTLYIRAAAANTTATPTFTPNGVLPIAAKTIVKGSNSPLVAGDIAGAGHWLELQYDGILDKWVLLNPAVGVSTLGQNQTMQDVTAARAFSTNYTNTSGKPIFVIVVGQITSTNPSTIIGAVGGATPLYGSTAAANLGNSSSISFIVPPGFTYSTSMAGGPANLAKWYELR